MIRLFVGLSLPETHRQQLALIQHGLKGARWISPENLHVTVRFIGEVDEDVAEDLCAALDQVTSPPFDLTLTGVGTFGRPPHSLWAGVADRPGQTLAHFQSTVESALVRAGLDPEGRKYSPHVTLARCKKSTSRERLGAYLEGHGDFALPEFRVNEFTLFQSHLGQGGAHYTPYAVFDF